MDRASLFSGSLVVVLFVLSIYLSIAAGQDHCNGKPNNNPIWTNEPLLVSSARNGKLYVVGPSENQLNILHVWGTPYEMGYAHGTLLKAKVLQLFSQFYLYVEEQADTILKYLPADVRKIIEDDGVDAGLAFEVMKTQKYIASYFHDEVNGLADAVGLPRDHVLRFMMFPELIKAQCTIVGAWGAATSNGTGGGLMQLRALDFGIDNPFRQVPLLTVYHPSGANGHPFATLGWTGFIGALTGFSPYVGASEKVWLTDHGKTSRAGIPWHFLFRDMLQFDETVDDAINRINNATRTCSLFLGIGDHRNTFRLVEYSHDPIHIFDDRTPFPGFVPSPPQHPLINGVVYVDKDDQPSKNPCLASLLQQYYGHIDPASLIQTTALHQTGDLHIAIYNYKTNQIYIALATQNEPFPPVNPSNIVPANTRPFIQLDMNTLFNLSGGN